MVTALRALEATASWAGGAVVVFLNSDEEVGSPDSGPEGVPAVLLVGHTDTVYPQQENMPPFRIEGDQVIAEAFPPVALHDEAYSLELARHECSDLVDPRLVGGSALDVDQTLEQSKGLPCLI